MNISVISIFCEDIREEKSGTETLVGVFPQNINALELPISMSKLGIYSRINYDVNVQLNHVSSKLVYPDGEEVEFGDVEREIIASSRNEVINNQGIQAGIISRVVFAPFHLRSAGLIKVIFDIDGVEYIGATLNVRPS